VETHELWLIHIGFFVVIALLALVIRGGPRR
jgi:hypothetical protein